MVSEPRTTARIRAALISRPDPTTRLNAWLADLPSDDGIGIVSTPVHFGGTSSGEVDYADQFTRSDALEERIGDTLKHAVAGARSAPALEIGVGTGILTRPLVQYADYPAYLITDTSPDFLRLTRCSIPGGDNNKRGSSTWSCQETSSIAGWSARSRLSSCATRFTTCSTGGAS